MFKDFDIQKIAELIGGSFTGGLATGAFFGTLILIALGIFIVYWLYTSFVWVTIAKKLKHKKEWLAWIPFARTAMILELGGFNWQWVFLWLIPILGWIALFILGVICSWRIYEKRNYPAWLALIPILGFAGGEISSLASIANLIILGFVAWKDR